MTPISITARILVCTAILFTLAGCASGPDIDLDRYDHRVTPREVVANIAAHRDREVLWGGLIIGINNTDKTSELEILAYPLMRGARPDLLLAPTGRFIARGDGFPDSLEVAPGNPITVAGPVLEVVRGRLGETETRFPLVRLDHLYPWSGRTPWRDPQVGFGFGFFYAD